MNIDKIPTNRVHELDALRGIALFGILLVNIFIFHAPYSYYSEFYGAFEGTQGLAVEAVINFASGKFLFIFAFLLGYGIAIQKQTNGKLFYARHIKRMLTLLVFGVIHILFFWFGDILTSYALIGLLLLPILRLPERFIFSIGVFLLLFSPVYYLGVVGFNWPLVEMGKPAELHEFIHKFQKGNFNEIFSLRMGEFYSFLPENLVWFIPKTMGLFLIGFYSGKKNFTAHIQQAPKKYLFTFITLLILSLTWIWLKLDFFAKFDLEINPWMRPFLIFINILFQTAQSITYIIGFLLLFQNNRGVLKLFVSTGRLALTNYFMQSLICVILFFGYGFGLYGKLLPTDLILISIVIFIFNSWFSKQYLRYNRYGPLEYLWRKMIL